MPPKYAVQASSGWFNAIPALSEFNAIQFKEWRRSLEMAIALTHVADEGERVMIAISRTSGPVREAIEGMDPATIKDTLDHLFTEMKRLSCPSDSAEKSQVMRQLSLLEAGSFRQLISEVDTLRSRARHLQLGLPEDVYSDAVLNAISKRSEELGSFLRGSQELDDYPGLRTVVLRQATGKDIQTKATATEIISQMARQEKPQKKKPTRACKHCHKAGHWDKDCWSLEANKDRKPPAFKMRSQTQQEKQRGSKGPCFKCGKHGHFARDCRSGMNHPPGMHQLVEQMNALTQTVGNLTGGVQQPRQVQAPQGPQGPVLF